VQQVDDDEAVCRWILSEHVLLPFPIGGGTITAPRPVPSYREP
jgi:hypothetical protein